MVTFSFERGTSLVPEMVEARGLLDDLVSLAKVVERGGATAWDDAGVRRELGHAAAELDALWNLVKRTVSEAARTGVPGVGASVVKLYYSELIQRIGDLSLRVLDRAALSLDDVYERSGHFVEERLRVLALTIAAGSSQIQRNIVAERILGLPKGA
jgi:alkylation response protein AidB-like acyl-CoA dehydrogenase